jgi:hypothetical protein
MTDHFIQQQIAEFACKYPSAAPKKEIATETPKGAQRATPGPVPKKSGVIQLQCTNFPKKSPESSENSEYTDDSDDSNDSNDSDDNIVSDSSESCACDEEGPCDHHMIMRALAKYEYQQYVACVLGKK